VSGPAGKQPRSQGVGGGGHVVAGGFVRRLLVVPWNGLVGKRATADRTLPDTTGSLIPNLVGAVKGLSTSSGRCSGTWPGARQSYAGPRSVQDKATASDQIDASIAAIAGVEIWRSPAW